MEKEEFIFIQDQIGYQFKNLDLLQQAFVRRSYSQENGGEDNEVLEFIGDRALDIVVVKYLVDTYGGFVREYEDFDPNEDYDEFFCDCNESKLTRIKQSLVCRKKLAECIENLELENFLIMGRSDVRQKVWKQDSVKEDLFEAIVGAVTLDSQWNFNRIEDTVKVMLGDALNDFSDEEINYVNEVQQWCLWKHDIFPRYNYSPESYLVNWWPSPFDERIGMPEWATSVINPIKLDHVCNLTLGENRLSLTFHGYGRSNAEARYFACKAAYKYLENHNLFPTIKDEIDDPNWSESISQLEILARRGYFKLPKYYFKEMHDSKGCPIWECTCIIPDYDLKTKGTSSKKKEAKKDAAFEALKCVLRES